MAKRENLEQVSEALRDTSFTADEVLKIIAATTQKRCYYPELAEALGLEAAVFLTQMEWRWVNNGSSVFYKYVDECDSCRKGDSWAGELGITRYQVKAVLDKVATRVNTEKKVKELLQSGTEVSHLVVYRKPNRGAMRWYFNHKLFLKLRASILAKSEIPFEEISNMAICEKLENGQIKENPISYSEQEQNNNIEEGKNVKSLLEDDSAWDVAVDTVKRQVVTGKSNKPTYKPQADVVENNKYGTTMPLDFSVSPSIIAQAIEKYGDEEWVRGEELKFVEHFTNKNTTFRVVDWSARFINKWLIDAMGYKLANEKKYGRTTKSASAERLGKLEEFATTDIFGDASFEDLGRSLYEERYGSDEDSSHT